MVGLSTGFTYLAFSYHLLNPVFLAVAVTVAGLGAGLLGWSFVAPRLMRHQLEKNERGHRRLPAGRPEPLLLEASSLPDEPR